MIRIMVFIAACLLSPTGCSDDAMEPERAGFAMTFVVTNDQGNPVSGLRAGLSPALPESLVTVHPPHRACDLPDPQGLLTQNVRDVAGRLIWTSTDTLVNHPPVWNGQDQDGHPVHDGWYEREYILRHLETSAVLDSTVTPGFYYSGADPDSYLVGTTNAEGTFTVTDRTFVPAFYEPGPLFSWTDDDTTEFELTPETWLRLAATDGNEMWHVFNAVDGPQTVSVIWTPDP